VNNYLVYKLTRLYISNKQFLADALAISNKQLSEFAKLSNTIKCECLKHISDLLRDLVAFEIYSAECENENTEDAALHSYLHATTAQARSMLEEALTHLIRVEGISIK